MGLIAVTTDYTDKDQAAIEVRLRSLVRSVFPEWSDETVADFGNVLLACFSFVGGVLTFYQDNQAGEAFFATATQRRSLLALCKQLNFSPPTASAATVDLTVSRPTAASNTVALKRGDIFTTPDVASPVAFQLLTDAMIQSGQTGVVVEAENSTDATDVFASNGAANQELLLTKTPYLDNSLALVAADGVYSQVANFLDASALDKVFTVVVDQNDRARVRFGNGTNGSIPVGTITSKYKTGGGSAGNVPANTIKRVPLQYVDSDGQPVVLSCTNTLKADGGNDRMSNAAIKLRAPASVRAPTNSVAREDFEINALRLASVARALMLTSNEDAAISENTGHLIIVPPGGGTPTGQILADVLNQVTVVYPCTLTFRPFVFGALYKTVAITAQIFKSPGFSGAQTKANILAALAAFFSLNNPDGSPNTNIDFGGRLLNAAGLPSGTLDWSTLFNTVRDSSGVRKIGVNTFLLNGKEADLPILPREFPQLGTVSLVDGDTGLALG
jgi:hypothetical protein